MQKPHSTTSSIMSSSLSKILKKEEKINKKNSNIDELKATITFLESPEISSQPPYEVLQKFYNSVDAITTPSLTKSSKAQFKKLTTTKKNRYYSIVSEKLYYNRKEQALKPFLDSADQKQKLNLEQSVAALPFLERFIDKRGKSISLQQDQDSKALMYHYKEFLRMDHMRDDMTNADMINLKKLDSFYREGIENYRPVGGKKNFPNVELHDWFIRTIISYDDIRNLNTAIDQRNQKLKEKIVL